VSDRQLYHILFGDAGTAGLLYGPANADLDALWKRFVERYGFEFPTNEGVGYERLRLRIERNCAACNRAEADGLPQGAFASPQFAAWLVREHGFEHAECVYFHTGED
jgi:hypothetical protein